MDPLPSKIAPRSATFTGFPASSFFYGNLRIQETLATIRYGIEARKGLVVLSGEAGIGKSTLLQKINADLGPNVICVMVSDPRLHFTDILRLILRSLDAQSASEDEAATLRNCKFHLRARMQRQQIVALIFDNAQHLADSTLRQLVQHFLDAGSPDRDGPLLQIVLAGRPQLKERLAQAVRLPGQLKLPIMCELHALEDFDTSSYIELGLRASALPMELFEPRAVRQIAVYSQGNPRWINAICDRALQLSDGRSSDTITLELIEGVAKDLDLRVGGLGGGRSAREHLADSAETFDPAQFQLGEKDTTEVVGETFLQYNRTYDRDEWFRPRRRKTRLLRTAVIFILFAGAGAWVQTESGANQLANWRDKLLGILQAHQQNDREIQTAALSPPIPNLSAASAEPNPDDASSPPEAQASGAPAVAQSESIVAPSRSASRHNSPQRREDLEAQVIQALENRAIIGVAVSVVQGTAFLDGRVATERQRRAAERAARSVTGVERVRNRIVVNFG